jgi:uroporphyrinogen-III synthase
VTTRHQNSGRVRGRTLVVPVTARRRELAERLARDGARVLEIECIAIAPTLDGGALRSAAAAWCTGEYDWMAVTSRNAAAGLAAAAEAQGLALGAVNTPVAVVGEATRRECADLGLRIGLVPAKADAQGLAEAFPKGSGRVLAPLGNRASQTLPDRLTAKGWTVDAVEAYRTVDGPGLSMEARRSLIDGSADALLLTSASVAERVRRDLGSDSVHPHTAIIAMGPSTARAAEHSGLAPSIVASTPSYDGILEALSTALEERP